METVKSPGLVEETADISIKYCPKTAPSQAAEASIVTSCALKEKAGNVINANESNIAPRKELAFLEDTNVFDCSTAKEDGTD